MTWRWPPARGVLLAASAPLILAACGNSPDPAATNSAASSPEAASAASAVESVQSPRCVPSRLSARVVSFGSTANSPFLVIALTNQGAARCHLRGYPGIEAVGRRAYTHQKSCALNIAVQRGSIYERHDPGPRRVELDPHGKAFFALGTGTAYDPPSYKITRLTITPPGTHNALHLRVALPATGPANKPIPIGGTALQSGRPRT